MFRTVFPNLGCVKNGSHAYCIASNHEEMQQGIIEWEHDGWVVANTRAEPRTLLSLTPIYPSKESRLETSTKDGLLITEDSVLPTTAPGGAPEQNRCYQTPATLLLLPLAPTSLARSAHLAPLTTLCPRWGLALFGSYSFSRIFGPATASLRGLLDHVDVESCSSVMGTVLDS